MININFSQPFLIHGFLKPLMSQLVELWGSDQKDQMQTGEMATLKIRNLAKKKKKKGGEEGKGDHVHTEAEVGIKSLWKKVCSPRAMRSYNKQGRFLPWSAQRERGSANTSVIDLTPEHRKKKFLFMRPFLHGNVIQPV